MTKIVCNGNKMEGNVCMNENVLCVENTKYCKNACQWIEAKSIKSVYPNWHSFFSENEIRNLEN